MPDGLVQSGSAIVAAWIPAFAGMTALQMTAVSKGSLGIFSLLVLLRALAKLDLGVGCRIERNVLPSYFECVASHNLPS